MHILADRFVSNYRKLLLVSGFFLGAVMLDAAPVTLQDAQNVALNWMRQTTGQSYRIKQLTDTDQLAASVATAPMFRFVQLEPRGWVLVALDDVARPVLGYGTSVFDPAKLPPATKKWLETQSQAIASAAKQTATDGLASGLVRDPRWDQLVQDPDRFTAALAGSRLGATMVVEPLLWLGGDSDDEGIRWDQTDYYNNQTPIAPSRSDDGHMLTGCVATAMGQVLYYFSQRGVAIHAGGSHSYNLQTSNGFQYDVGYVSATFGGYNWEEMAQVLDETSTQNEIDAVARLLDELGVAVEMDYGYGYGTTDSGYTDGGSLANYCRTYDTRDGRCLDIEYEEPSAYSALKSYFGFDIRFAMEEYYSTQWEDMLKDSLEGGYPVLYGGMGTGGHAFVLDGYGTEGYYHINWGYSGEYNGWYTLNALQPGGYDFSYDQRAIFFGGFALNVIPDSGEGYDGMVEGTGGGCTYNPRNTGMDIMMIFMIILASIYPFGRRYFR